jgi:hypothetical protein
MYTAKLLIYVQVDGLKVGQKPLQRRAKKEKHQESHQLGSYDDWEDSPPLRLGGWFTLHQGGV